VADGFESLINDLKKKLSFESHNKKGRYHSGPDPDCRTARKKTPNGINRI
jgi:hypothetical protein